MPKQYLKRVITYEPIQLDETDLITIADAARLLNVSMPTVTIRAQKGLLTTIQDPTSAGKHQGRNLLLRREVEAWKAARDAGANDE